MTAPFSLRRRQGVIALGAAALGGAARLASAQDARPIQIIVGYSPGGGSDVLARVLADALAKSGGRTAIVRNVAGAGGQIAASTLLREGADGNTILAINHPDLYLAAARNPPPFKAADFQPIMIDVQDPRILLVKRDSDIDSFATFVDRARAQPGKLSVSVTAAGGQELFAKWLFARLGLDVILVGYKGGAEAGNALLAGDVTANVGDDFARMNLRPQTRALLVASQQKSPRWPEAATLVGALAPYNIVPPSADFLSRWGLYVVPSALKSANPEAYRALQQTLLKARAAPEFQAYVAKSRLDDLSIGKPGEPYEPALAADLVEMSKIVK